jgi:hypothetical protein
MKYRTAFAVLLGIALIRGASPRKWMNRSPWRSPATRSSRSASRYSKSPRSRGLFDLIRGADAAFTNLKTLFHDYEMPPAHESGAPGCARIR